MSQYLGVRNDSKDPESFVMKLLLSVRIRRRHVGMMLWNAQNRRIVMSPARIAYGSVRDESGSAPGVIPPFSRSTVSFTAMTNPNDPVLPLAPPSVARVMRLLDVRRLLRRSSSWRIILEVSAVSHGIVEGSIAD